MDKKKLVLILILLVVTVYRLFFGLGTQPIERWDEKTNIDVVTDTINQNKFPSLYLGQEPFFEKPPLWYFLNIGIARTFGISNFSMRATSAFSGLLIIILSAYIAWRWWGTVAMIATWVTYLFTNQLFVNNAGGYFATHTFRSADLDALQLLFLLIAFISAVEFENNKHFSLVLGIFSGLAVLTKGPMGLLPIIILTCSIIINNRREIVRILKAWIVLMSIVLPWYIFMIANFGNDFIQANIIYHIAERALIPLEGHNSTMWFYLEILTSIKMFLPGIFLLVSFIWVILKKKFKERRIIFLLLIVLLSLIIPSLVQTKLAWYILPIYPFAAMLIGAFFGEIINPHLRN